MKKLIISTVLLVFLGGNLAAQTTDSVLENVAKNNHTIQATVQYWEAKRQEFRTGINPDDPRIGYDYFVGSPSGVGNQIEFEFIQSFDFPTAYLRKSDLAAARQDQVVYQVGIVRQQILFEAQLVSLELIYRSKLQAELGDRKADTEQWVNAFRSRLESGQGNSMDVNKATLRLLEIQAELDQNTSLMNQLHQKLTELNGGNPIEFTQSEYGSAYEIPDFATLESEIESMDPMRKLMIQNTEIAQKGVSVSRSMTLPKIQVGYRYQEFAGVRHNGIHLGLSLPLWQNRNTVSAQKARFSSEKASLDEHINEHYYETARNYEQMLRLQATLEAYRSTLGSMELSQNLDKALELGEISVVEYFLEAAYHHEAVKNYLKTDFEYQQILAMLFKHRLDWE